MGLKEDISKGMIKAMKAGEKLRVSTLRLMIAAIKYKEIDKGEALTDADVQQVATTMAKQRRDSIEQFRAGGREEMAKQEEAELEILTEFLPEQMSEADVIKVVEEVAGEVGASSPADMGKLMKGVMAKLKGSADGKVVQGAVKDFLAK